MKKILGQFLILLLIIACYASFIKCSDLSVSVMKSNIHYKNINKDEDNYKFIELNNKAKNSTDSIPADNESFDGVEPINPEAERFERYVKSMTKTCPDTVKDCGSQLRQLKNEYNIDFPEIENFESKEIDNEKEKKMFEDHLKLMGKKLMSADQINSRQIKMEELKKEGLSETKIQEELTKMNEADENVDDDNKKKDQKDQKDQKYRKMAKRINGQKSAIEIQQEILDKGTLNSVVYGVYKMQKRMWYLNKQIKYADIKKLVRYNNRGKPIWEYKIKVPVFMKEVEFYLQVNFKCRGSYQYQEGYKATLFLGKDPIGTASKAQNMRYISSPYSNFISENAILAGKLYNVNAGEHVISLIVETIGNGSSLVWFMDDQIKQDAILNITGFPNY